MHLYITRGCRATLPKFLRSKAEGFEDWRLHSSGHLRFWSLEIGNWSWFTTQWSSNEQQTFFQHKLWTCFCTDVFFHHQIIGTEHILKRLSVSDFNPTIFLLKGLQVVYQSSLEKLQSLERCCIHGDLNTISDPNLRSKSWWLVEKKGLRRSGFCLGVLECRKERWKASLNIFDLSSNVWRLMIRRFDDCDGVASHWLASRFERKLTHSRPRLVSRMKTRRCEQPHTMNSCKQMRNSRFFLACMSQRDMYCVIRVLWWWKGSYGRDSIEVASHRT